MTNNILIQLALVGSLACTLQADFIRDNSKEVVLDTKTNLIWQDNNESKTLTKTWSDAITYCEGLELGGYSDWHLPNFNELHSLPDRSKFNPALSSVFTNVVIDGYWSSTSTAGGENAWFVNFHYGNGYYGFMTNSQYIRCVRPAD